MLFGVLGSFAICVSAPLDGSIMYMPQLAANRNLPLAGEVKLSAEQFGANGDPDSGLRAPFVVLML
jgi:hypothetical protein